VKIACAVTIAAGTWVGGWRVIRTLGKRLVEISSPQGMAAETSSAVIILSSSHLGMALSTTQVASGSILGSGVGRVPVRWGVFGRMVVAWLLTLPSAGIVGAVCWFVANAIGGALGVTVIFGVLVLGAALMFIRSHRSPITPDNVNAEWEGRLAPAPEREPAKTARYKTAR
jgi:inorganic phosphate transporter, PiT family